MAAPIGLVMAGGEGTRLRPLTVTVPKPMLPVGSRAILEIVLRQIAAAGVTEIYVSVGYRGYLVRSYLRELAIPDATLHVVEEDAPLGTAGAMSLLPSGEGDVFVMNGDVLTRAPIDRALAHHAEGSAAVTMLVHRHPVTLPYGVLEVVDGEVVEILEKPTIEYRVATGMYVVSRRVVDALRPGERIDMPDLLTGLMASEDTVAAFEFDELWTDVADLADFEKVNLNSAEWEDL